MAKGKHIASVSMSRKSNHAARVTASGATMHGVHGAAMVRPSMRVASQSAAQAFVIAFVVIAIVAGAGFGLASATGAAMSEPTQQSEDFTVKYEAQVDLAGTSALAQANYRDVSGGVAEIEAEEEAARIVAEKKAKEKEAECIARAEKAQAESAASGGVGVYAVDWSVGHDAFVVEWTNRINAYLEGSPLAGYGTTFAEAAWNNGVDPRWSPAISNTESTKGRHCFAWHNAWGWTNGAWGDWTSAINAHVKGLSEVYGYTISYANAKRYCPPNYQNWYRDTVNEISKI